MAININSTSPESNNLPIEGSVSAPADPHVHELVLKFLKELNTASQDPPKSVIGKSNGDVIQKPERETFALSVDGIGLVRGSVLGAESATKSVAAFAPAVHGAVAGASVLGGVAAALVPFAFITGPLCMISSGCWAIPDAIESLEKFQKQLNTLKDSSNYEEKVANLLTKLQEKKLASPEAIQKFCITEFKSLTEDLKKLVPSQKESGFLDTQIKKLFGENDATIFNKLEALETNIKNLEAKLTSDQETDPTELNSLAKEVLSLSHDIVQDDTEKTVSKEKLRLLNGKFCFLMGLAQTLFALSLFLTAAAAHVMHYAPVVIGVAGKALLSSTAITLGAVYLARGIVMAVRSAWAYHTADRLNDALKSHKNMDEAIRFMESVETLGSEYLQQRMSMDCLQDVDESGNLSKTYTASGMINANGALTPYATEDEKKKYLQRVDKAIYTQKLKAQTSGSVAASFILGGGLLIASSILSGGAADVVAAVSAIFFFLAERYFVRYDASKIFEAYRNKSYTPSQWTQSSVNNRVRAVSMKTKEKPQRKHSFSTLETSEKSHLRSVGEDTRRSRSF